MKIALLSENENLVTLIKHTIETQSIDLQHLVDREQVKTIVQQENSQLLAIILDFPNSELQDFYYWSELLNLTSIPILILSSNEDQVARVLLRQQAILHLSTPLTNLSKLLYENNDGKWSDDLVQLATDVFFNVGGHCIQKHQECHQLSSTEFKLLYLLAQNIGNSRTSDELMDYANLNSVSSLYVHVKKLREKIEDDPRNPVILTNHRGVGYRIQPLIISDQANPEIDAHLHWGLPR